MKKGRPQLTNRVKRVIAEEYINHPHWLGKEIAAEVKRRLGDKAPAISTIFRELAKLPKEESELDEPWSLASMDIKPEFEIPPESLPFVLQIFKYRILGNEPFSIREAKWVARLSLVVPDMVELSSIARQYSLSERICQLSGLTPDSTLLDKMLMGILDTITLVKGVKEEEIIKNSTREKVKGQRNQLEDYKKEAEEIVKSLKMQKEAKNERLNQRKG